jgi:hypothetical protein
MRIRSTTVQLFLAAFVLSAAAASTFGQSQRKVTQLADGVYEIQHEPNGNTTVIIGERQVFVVDTCFLPSAAREDIAQIRQWTDKPVSFVLNTHFHNDPSEDSSGERTQRGSITKTGNAHLRRIAVEAAWSYRLRPCVGPALRKRQEGVAEEIKEIAWKAQHRLHKRYCRLAATRKDQRKIITAIGRELLGFIWAIGIKAEAAARPPIAA